MYYVVHYGYLLQCTMWLCWWFSFLWTQGIGTSQILWSGHQVFIIWDRISTIFKLLDHLLSFHSSKVHNWVSTTRTLFLAAKLLYYYIMQSKFSSVKILYIIILKSYFIMYKSLINVYIYTTQLISKTHQHTCLNWY